ncbi:MAG TPA: hypothetical protein VI756_01900 [Blastocatellia bacterium]
MQPLMRSLRIGALFSMAAGLGLSSFPGGNVRAGAYPARTAFVRQMTVALSSGVAVTGSIPAASPDSCSPDTTQYTIDVPSGAMELAITLSGDQTDNLLVSIGQPVTVSDGQAVADYIANSPGASQTLAIGPSSSPALQAATYYIDVSNCSTSAFNFTLTATVTGGTIDTPPTVTGLQASLSGNLLTLTGTAQDAGGDMTEANVVFLDGSGNPLGTTTPFPYDFGTATTVNFNITVQGLNQYLQALQASLTIIDNQGNTSTPIVASFANGDPGGPQLSLFDFDGLHNMLTIKGSAFKTPTQLEVDGEVVAPPLKVKIKGGSKKKGGTKLVIDATGPQLNLNSGFNRVRVISNGLRSQLIVVTI